MPRLARGHQNLGQNLRPRASPTGRECNPISATWVTGRCHGSTTGKMGRKTQILLLPRRETHGLGEDYSCCKEPFCAPGHKGFSLDSGVDRVAEERQSPPTFHHVHGASQRLGQILGSAFSPTLYCGLQDRDRLTLQAQHNPPTAPSYHRPGAAQAGSLPSQSLSSPGARLAPRPGKPLPVWAWGSPRGCNSCRSPPLVNAALGPLGYGYCDASVCVVGEGGRAGAQRPALCADDPLWRSPGRVLRCLDLGLHGSHMAKTPRDNRLGVREVLSDALLLSPR